MQSESSTNDLTFGPVITEEDAAGALDAIRLSFGGNETTARGYLQQFRDEAFMVRSRSLSGARGDSPSGVVGCVTLLPMGHWLGGRCVPMLGVRAVGVPPAHRGRGVAKWMMQAVVQHARSNGYPLSTLYASTQSLYRKVGYEQAGWRFEHDVEPRQVRSAAESGSLARSALTQADYADVRGLYEASCPGRAAALRRGDSYWRDTFEPRKTDGDGVVFRDSSGNVRAYVLFSLVPSTADRARPYEVRVRDFAAVDADGWASLVGFIASFGTLAFRVRFACGPSNPLLMATAEAMRAQHTELWMTRVCDAPAAIMARGYPGAVGAEFRLRLEDALVPANRGVWRVVIEDGNAEVSQAGDSDDSPMLTTSVRGLGPMITGHQHPRTLAELGFVSGEDRALDAAGHVFAGPAPGLVDMF